MSSTRKTSSTDTVIETGVGLLPKLDLVPREKPYSLRRPPQLRQGQLSTWSSYRISSSIFLTVTVVMLDRSRSDRKSTRLNSSHVAISYAVFCLKKKKTNRKSTRPKSR